MSEVSRNEDARFKYIGGDETKAGTHSIWFGNSHVGVELALSAGEAMALPDLAFDPAKSAKEEAAWFFSS